MKPFLKVVFFLAILTALDFLFRKGLVGFFIPFALPKGLALLLLFTIFAALSWFVTKAFCKSDGLSLTDLGISSSTKNRFEFLWGFLIGLGLWAIVSMAQSVTAGISWTLRPDFNSWSLLYGLLFIFIADLGTELFTRGYPLTRLKDSFGAIAAMMLMVAFVAIKSISFDVQGEMLFYVIAIPALHTVFFSIIYFKTKSLGGALGVHTGANFATISIFDLRIPQQSQAIPSGIFESKTDLETLSMTALQMPYVIMAIASSIAVYFWWQK